MLPFEEQRGDNASYNAHFTYPRGGAIEYINALLKDLPDGRVRYETALTDIDLDARVAHTTAGPIQYEHLVTSMPFVKILDAAGLDYEPEVYTWNKVLVFNLGFNKKGQTRDHWLYIPEREYCFYRVGFYDNIFQTDRMSLYVEIGMDRNQDPGDPGVWLERVLTDLARLGIVDDHELVSWHSIASSSGIPPSRHHVLFVLTHHCRGPPSPKMGEGFQSDMNFSFFIREKVAVRPDEGPVGTIKTAMSLP